MINQLAWRQLTNEKLRLFAAVAGITFIAMLQLMQFGFSAALFTTATTVYSKLQADLVLVSTHYEYMIAPGDIPRRRLYQTLMHKDVKSVASVHLSIAPFKDAETHDTRQVLLIGVSPDEDAIDAASIGANLAQLKIADTVLLDSRSRPEYRPILARFRRDGILVAEATGRRIEVTGLFEMGLGFTGNANMLTSDSTFRRIFSTHEGAIQLGLVRLNPGSDVEAVRASLAAALPADVQVVTREQFLQMERDYWDRTQPVGFIFNSGLFVALIVGAVIVYQILYTDVTGHLPEYATLKAMGYRDRSLYMVVIQEAVILSVLAFPVGLVFALGIYYLTREVTGLPVTMTFARIATVFSLTMVMCTLSGLMAMRKLKSADPADAF